MLREKFMLTVLMTSFLFITSCGQDKVVDKQVEPTIEKLETTKVKYQKKHPYGGWYCPDNFGFPPVDIQELDKVPVVLDRLPTREETQDGTSLIFFDLEKYPDARPLEMDLPRLATIYSRRTEMHEQVIVIQAAIAGEDTLVGYRFPNGGNGSAWFGEVSFLSNKEVDDKGSLPFVYIHSEINASKKQVWEAICSTSYAKELGKTFNKKAFFESDWTADSGTHLYNESAFEVATGSVSDVWGNLYLHIDYDKSNFHYSEKMLVSEDTENNTAELHIVFGPYPGTLEAQQEIWGKWFKEVKEKSEKI